MRHDVASGAPMIYELRNREGAVGMRRGIARGKQAARIKAGGMGTT